MFALNRVSVDLYYQDACKITGAVRITGHILNDLIRAE